MKKLLLLEILMGRKTGDTFFYQHVSLHIKPKGVLVAKIQENEVVLICL